MIFLLFLVFFYVTFFLLRFLLRYPLGQLIWLRMLPFRVVDVMIKPTKYLTASLVG